MLLKTKNKKRPLSSPRPSLYLYLSHTVHLVGVDVDDFVHVERKEDVEEQDLVAPDNSLLLALATQPLRPLVRHELHPEPAQPRPNRMRRYFFSARTTQYVGYLGVGGVWGGLYCCMAVLLSKKPSIQASPMLVCCEENSSLGFLLSPSLYSALATAIIFLLQHPTGPKRSSHPFKHLSLVFKQCINMIYIIGTTEFLFLSEQSASRYPRARTPVHFSPKNSNIRSAYNQYQAIHRQKQSYTGTKRLRDNAQFLHFFRKSPNIHAVFRDRL